MAWMRSFSGLPGNAWRALTRSDNGAEQGLPLWHRWVLASFLALASVGLIWLGTQIGDQLHGPDPGGKVFVASWLESELWVNPWLIGVGLLGLLVAILLLVLGRPNSSQPT